MKTTKTSLITDDQTLVSAKTRFGHDIPVYDDSWGKLYISRDSMGINGIVRAQTWEDAYEICEDEFFPAASDTWEQMHKEYPEMDDDQSHDYACWSEAYGFRPNGARELNEPCPGVYVKDLNGDYLDELTAELASELEITLVITNNDDDEQKGE